jgi:hypothetical protein
MPSREGEEILFALALYIPRLIHILPDPADLKRPVSLAKCCDNNNLEREKKF